MPETIMLRTAENALTSTLSEACGLKHTSKPEDPSHDVDTSKPDGQPPTVSEEALAVLRKQRDEIASWMIQVKKDFCTPGQLRSVKGKHAWTAFSRQDVDDILDALAAQKLMHKSSLTLPKLGLTDVFSPKVSTTKSMTDVIDVKHDNSAAFPEAYDCQSLQRHMLSHKGRLANNQVLQQAHRTKAKELKKGKGGGAGVPTKEHRMLQDDQEALVQTMCNHIRQEQALFTEMQNYLEDGGVGVEQHEMVVQRTYAYKLETRCRRSVNGSGAQSFSKVFRNIVCKNMRDFDFHASMFTLVVQLVDKLDTSFNETLPSLKAWRAIANNRQRVCEDILQCSPVRGKALLLQVANGQAVSSADDISEKGQQFLEDLSKESRCLRWLARSLCPDIYEKVKDGTDGFKQSSWPEATVFSYWWYSAEDYCLSSMLDLLRDLDVPRQHISLHFDGLLLSNDLVQAVEQKHGGNSEWLLVTELLQKVNQANTRAKERGYRCYKDWSEYNQRLAMQMCKLGNIYETFSNKFVASGTKQLRVIAAMYDDDAARQASHSKYMSRSAELLRSQVKPGVSSKKNVIDKDIRLCLTTKGPSFMSMQKIKQAKDLRRVGNVYYDRSFANDFMCNAVASRASFRQIAAYFTSSTARHQGALCSMLPEASHSFWCNVLEDLTQSPQIKVKLQDLLQECEAHTEFEYLSIDGTVKCMMKIIGQAHFNSSQDCRDAAAIPDSDAAYKLLTVRGRTNAVLGLCGVRSEGSREIASGLSSMLTLSQRAQVLHMASDSPSVELFATLKNIFPNLQSLGLDAMHIVMVYEQNHNNKRTKGSRWLATVMNKFRNIDVECPAAAWGPMYTGQQQIHYTAEEKRLSALVSNASMPQPEAMGILQQLDPDSPWRTESQFLEAMAAICTLFQDELTKTTFSGPTLHRLLINLTSPVKIKWLFNDTRYRHTC
ncbi:unnamed protein product, partial [Symbiodinium microadriaticum]